MGLSHLMERPKESVAHHSIRAGVIATLGSWIYATYLTDVYFQTYANSLAPVFGPGSQRRLASSASIAIYLYVSMKEMRAVQKPAVSAKKKPSLRKMPKESSQPSMQPPKAADAVVQTTKPSLSQSRPDMSTLRRKNPLLGRMRQMFSPMEPAKNHSCFC